MADQHPFDLPPQTQTSGSAPAPSTQQQTQWEQRTLEKLVFASLQEQKRARIWKIIFRSLTFLYLFLIFFALMGWLGNSKDSNKLSASMSGHTAVIDFRGVITADSKASASYMIEGLRAAFEDSNTKGVIIRANSPGGSPVQSAYIYDEINRLRKLHPSIKVYTVVEDMCASGCYYAAAASDGIYVNQASLIGSIGVLMDGFGFTGTMEKLGIERRLITAGSNKGFLDPFSPTNPEQLEYTKTMLSEIHQQFITAVKNGRGKRLKETPDTFSGLFWHGAKGVEMGLADGFGSVDSIARDVIKAEDLVDFTPQESPLDRFAERIGMGASTQLQQPFTQSLR